MQLVIHTGAHFTEEDRLMRCLLRNRADFARRGVEIPAPSSYRRLFRDVMDALDGSEPTPGAREILLEAMAIDTVPQRLVLSSPHLFGAPRASVMEGELYPQAIERMAALARLFPGDEIEMFMAIRNPASFLPAAFGKSPRTEMDRFLGHVHPAVISWSRLFKRLSMDLPDIALTVWCSEDSPMIWAQIIREMAALEPGEKITGGFDLLGSIMSRTGMKRFRAYLAEHPHMNESQKRRVIAAFLTRYAIDEEIEEELDLPGWTTALVEEMTESYDEDVLQIQRLPGVRMICP